MNHIRIDEIDVEQPNPADLSPLSDPLETEQLALNHYVLAPGDRFGFDLHCHYDQEEVFYVQDGTVTFELEDGAIEVGPGEVIRFAPGEFQLGVNRSDAPVVALAIGAPKGSQEIEYLRECPACGERTVQSLAPGEAREGFVLRCTACEAEFVPVPE